MDWKRKKVLVIGLARTGLEVARFLARQGAEIAVTDRKPVQELEQMDSLKDVRATYHFGGEDPAWLAGVDLIVPSPGVPPTNLLLQEAARREIEILSEIEVAARFIQAPLVAITGTNGKSTTTDLIGALLRAGGREVEVCGNIGRAVCEVAE